MSAALTIGSRAVTLLRPSVLHPTVEGRYELVGDAIDVDRRVIGVNARWAGVRALELVSIAWRSTGRGSAVHGRGRLMLARPLWIPAGASVVVVVEIVGVGRAAHVTLDLSVDELAEARSRRAA